jgi:hypothetical protein
MQFDLLPTFIWKFILFIYHPFFHLRKSFIHDMWQNIPPCHQIFHHVSNNIPLILARYFWKNTLGLTCSCSCVKCSHSHVHKITSLDFASYKKALRSQANQEAMWINVETHPIVSSKLLVLWFVLPSSFLEWMYIL